MLMTSLAALLPLGFAFGAVAGGDGPTPYATGPRCDIRVVNEGGALVLEGLAFASVPSSGSYDFRISQGGPAGGSNIEQGGDFEAGPGAEASLGLISLSDQGGYSATLTVHWHDGAPDCTRRVGSRYGL
jgi:hypothetical protein